MHSFTGVAASIASTYSAFGLFTQNARKPTRSSHTSSSSLWLLSRLTSFSTSDFVRMRSTRAASSSASSSSTHAKWMIEPEV